MLFSSLRRAVDPSGGTWRFSTVLVAVGIAGYFLPESTVRVALTSVVLTACVGNVGRIAIHVLLGDYLRLRPAKIRERSKPVVQMQLSALVLGNMTLTVGGLAGATLLIGHPEAPLLWHVVPAAVLCLAFYLVALATVDRATELKLKRGTEIVRDSRFGGWLFSLGRKGVEFRPVQWLLDVFDTPTPAGHASTLSVLIAATLLFAPLATLEIELGLGVKAAAITTLEHWSEDTEAKEDAPPTAPVPEPHFGLAPARAGHETAVGGELHVIVSKTEASDPKTFVPLHQSDIPYVLTTLTVIFRLRQLAESEGGAWNGGSFYMVHGGATLFFEVAGQTTAKAHSGRSTACPLPTGKSSRARAPDSPVEAIPCPAGKR